MTLDAAVVFRLYLEEFYRLAGLYYPYLLEPLVYCHRHFFLVHASTKVVSRQRKSPHFRGDSLAISATYDCICLFGGHLSDCDLSHCPALAADD